MTTKKKRLPYHCNRQLDEIKMLTVDNERVLEPIMRKVRNNQPVSPLELAVGLGAIKANGLKIRLAANSIAVEGIK